VNAQEANSVDRWNALWSDPGQSWRASAMANVYQRIAQLMPPVPAIDIGGGRGDLARFLCDHGFTVAVWDHSATALELATQGGLQTNLVDLCGENLPEIPQEVGAVLATEVLEHLNEIFAWRILARTGARTGFFSVPNNRLGPDEEPQHVRKWTAIGFKRWLADYFDDVRVEVIDGFLLGIVNEIRHDRATLSVTMPARDEAADIERVLASFRGVADQLVIGVDPRSKDRTREIAECYADEVFDLVEPEGPPEERMPEGGVHFSWLRNQCLERCTSDWIFMTEAHEGLKEGQDILLALGSVMPPEAKVGYVLREGDGQRWAFPWLFRRDANLRYARAVHNALVIPHGTLSVKIQGIVTLHARSADNAKARAGQRKVQNRRTLLDDWVHGDNEESLFYLAQELRVTDPTRSIARYKQFLARRTGNGPARYQARLVLSRLLMEQKEHAEARTVLLGCAEDDWSRTEHWMRLGDLAFGSGLFEEAKRWYELFAVGIGKPPFSSFWYDVAAYSYLPAQRLAQCCGELGLAKEALDWARKVAELLPKDASCALVDEAASNVTILEAAIELSDR